MLAHPLFSWVLGNVAGCNSGSMLSRHQCNACVSFHEVFVVAVLIVAFGNGSLTRRMLPPVVLFYGVRAGVRAHALPCWASPFSVTQAGVAEPFPPRLCLRYAHLPACLVRLNILCVFQHAVNGPTQSRLYSPLQVAHACQLFSSKQNNAQPQPQHLACRWGYLHHSNATVILHAVQDLVKHGHGRRRRRRSNCSGQQAAGPVPRHRASKGADNAQASVA
jgi:hypothetical protein